MKKHQKVLYQKVEVIGHETYHTMHNYLQYLQEQQERPRTKSHYLKKR